MQTYSTILFDVDDRVATITLNRPQELNPLDDRTVEEMHDCLDRIESDAAIEIIVIRAAGRAFSAGGDLKRALSRQSDPVWMEYMGRELRRLFSRLEQNERIVIAVVQGLCVAGGIELILCCDWVIAGDNAKFSDGHLNFSLLPGAGGTQRLPRAVGVLRAKELLLSARFFSGAEAAEIGLVTCCVPAAEVDARVADTTADLLRKSYSSRKAIKYLVNQGLSGSLPDGLQLEAAYVLHYESTHPDAKEGLRAFVEKRAPAFLSRRMLAEETDARRQGDRD